MPKKSVWLLFGIFALALAEGPALAEPPKFTDRLSDGFLKHIMKTARANITTAVVSDGSHVPPETAEELKKPIVPPEEARRAVDAGILSAYAERCGEDWERNYRQLMAYQRGRKIWSDKQLAYISLMHGIAQGSIGRSFADAGACSELEKQKVRQYIESPW